MLVSICLYFTPNHKKSLFYKKSENVILKIMEYLICAGGEEILADI